MRQRRKQKTSTVEIESIQKLNQTTEKEEIAMAQTSGTETEIASNGHDEATEKGKRTSIGIRLQAVNNSDQPIVANHTSLHPASGMVLIDFGFIEPSVLAALPHMAKQGKKLPETMNGKLAVRVALAPEALASLHRQLTQLLSVGKRTDVKT
jgi:hypothetical protein